jgi:hypothetical protein
MFQHITLLFSFIFAIALTHIFASATALIIARDRVRFSGIHAIWMIVAAMSLLVDWLGFFGLESIKHWSAGELTLQLSWAIPQYFTCSLISMKVPESGAVDMGAFYDRHRPAFFSAFIALCAISMITNFADRNYFGTWIGQDLSLVPMVVGALVAGWAKSRWLQWLVACIMLALAIWFSVSYAGLD